MNKIIALAMLLVPSISFAQVPTETLHKLKTELFISKIIIVTVFVAIFIFTIYFLIKLLKFIKKKTDEMQNNYMKWMVWGVVIIIAVMIAWQIFQFLNQKACCVIVESRTPPPSL